MNNYYTQVLDTPWKGYYFVTQLIYRPLLYLYFLICGLEYPKGSSFYGFPRIFRHRGSAINIGDNFENRNWTFCNPLGINHATIITTWGKNAKIRIGKNVGISGGAICATSQIEIGDNCLIGANCTIIDTDFHPVSADKRRYKKVNIGKPIVIEDNVFIGMNTTVLKGVRIGMNSVVGAGSIVRDNIPANHIYNNGKLTPLKK
jgi:acetyltransferase-like isoleucine patch superfamily enzyme